MLKEGYKLAETSARGTPREQDTPVLIPLFIVPSGTTSLNVGIDVFASKKGIS